MRTFIIIAVLICVVFLMVKNYVETEKISILPPRLTPQEKEMLLLKKDLRKVNRELAMLDRQAREIGLAATQALVPQRIELEQRKEELEKKIDGLQH